jgi:stage II sporulation protein GA (sporulation sigma-E factor processing peptidase)
MVRYVYVDVLFVVNLTVNYLILSATGKLAGRTISWKRLALASVLGAVYAGAQLYVPHSAIFLLPARVLFGILMVVIAYPNTKGVGLVILAASFYLSSAVAAGTAYALLNAEGAFILGNSVFTGEERVVRWWMVAASLVVLAGIPLVAAAGGYRPGRKLPLLEVELVLYGKTVPLTGLVDTGNNLRDPFSGLPVVVADWEAVKPVVPSEAAAFFKSTWDNIPETLLESPIGSRVRLVPCNSVTGRKSVLPAFRPDGLFIKEDNGVKVLKKAIVGISVETLSTSGLFQVLIHPDLINS